MATILLAGLSPGVTLEPIHINNLPATVMWPAICISKVLICMQTMAGLLVWSVFVGIIGLQLPSRPPLWYRIGSFPSVPDALRF